MRLHKTRLHEIGPFRDFEVDFDAFGDARLVAVVGANGAGKSCLLEMALPGVLYRDCPTQGTLIGRAKARDSFVESTVTNGSTYTIRHSLDVVTKKGETLVTDAEGKQVLPTTSVAAFDVWAESHLPKPEVFFSTAFWAQKKKGFIGEGKGDRKAILLRTKGIERYERLAKAARDHGAEVKTELDALRVRMDDERERGGYIEGFEAELAHLEASATAAAGALDDARGALEIGKAEKPAMELARREAKAKREKRAELDTRIRAKTAELAGLEDRIRNNRAVLADAEQIRAAKTRSDEFVIEVGAAEQALASTLARRASSLQESELHASAARAAKLRETAARSRADGARVRLANRKQIEAAAESLPGIEDALQRAQSAEVAASAALESVRGERIAGADERIAGLRGGLDRILGDARRARQGVYDGSFEAFTESVETSVGVVLDRDDGYVGQATELPARLKAAEAALRDAKWAEQQNRVLLDAARAMAARAPELDAAARELEQAEKDAAAGAAEHAEADDKAVRARATVAEFDAKATGQRAAIDTLRQEVAALASLAAKAGPLANAEGRLAELEPQAATVRTELVELETALATTPEPPAEPKVPELATLEAELSRAETAARAAGDAVALSRGCLQRARESLVKVEAFEKQARALEEDLADWTRLAKDFGRDGLQAAEIDAAAPELTELTNDLLRACFGPRWTVSLQTTGRTADGKRETEGCEVNVIDTEAGRDADAKEFSGGEQVLLGEAVSLALTMIDCRRSGVEGVTLVRDETGAALSPANGRAYVQMLRRAAELVGASRVLFVCHDPALQELADAVIDVGAAS